jgi:hypothetical protein
MMFWMTKPGEPGVISKAYIFGDLVKHALIQLRSLSSHARLKFVAATQGGVDEKMELHGVLHSNKQRR